MSNIADLVDQVKKLADAAGVDPVHLASAAAARAAPVAQAAGLPLPAADTLANVHATADKVLAVLPPLLAVVGTFYPPVKPAAALVLPLLQGVHAFAGALESGQDPSASVQAVVAALKALAPAASA